MCARAFFVVLVGSLFHAPKQKWLVGVVLFIWIAPGWLIGLLAGVGLVAAAAIAIGVQRRAR
jgi:hypothetical protein